MQRAEPPPLAALARPEALDALSRLAEAGEDTGVAPRFGHVYTARLRRAGDSPFEIPPSVQLRMEFLRRADPASAVALALSASLLGAALDARALLRPTHAEALQALVDGRPHPCVGPALAALFATAHGPA